MAKLIAQSELQTFKKVSDLKTELSIQYKDIREDFRKRLTDNANIEEGSLHADYKFYTSKSVKYKEIVEYAIDRLIQDSDNPYARLIVKAIRAQITRHTVSDPKFRFEVK